MKRTRIKNFLLITVLIIATGVAMAYSSNTFNVFPSGPIIADSGQNAANTGFLSVSAHLIQNKVLQGSDGTVGLSLTLHAEEATTFEGGEPANVDMVVVLDRSGSMKGRKIDDARRAVEAGYLAGDPLHPVRAPLLPRLSRRPPARDHLPSPPHAPIRLTS